MFVVNFRWSKFFICRFLGVLQSISSFFKRKRNLHHLSLCSRLCIGIKNLVRISQFLQYITQRSAATARISKCIPIEKRSKWKMIRSRVFTRVPFDKWTSFLTIINIQKSNQMWQFLNFRNISIPLLFIQKSLVNL